MFCATENLTSASFLMASPTFSFLMLKAFVDSMWLFWPHSVLQQWFLSRFLSSMRCQNSSLPHLPLSFHFSQPALRNAWRMKEMLPQLLLWLGFCQTYLFLGEDLQVWSHLTFMPCRLYYLVELHFTFVVVGRSISGFPCLSLTLSKFPAIIIWLFVAIQERFYFGDNILPCFESGIPLLKRRLQDLPDSDNVSLSLILFLPFVACVFMLFLFIYCSGISACGCDHVTYFDLINLLQSNLQKSNLLRSCNLLSGLFYYSFNVKLKKAYIV